MELKSTVERIKESVPEGILLFSCKAWEAKIFANLISSSEMHLIYPIMSPKVPWMEIPSLKEAVFVFERDGFETIPLESLFESFKVKRNLWSASGHSKRPAGYHNGRVEFFFEIRK